MADHEKRILPADDKLTENLRTVVSFLDPKLATRAKADRAAKWAMWSWRKTIAFVFVTGLIGWSLALGMAYLLYLLWNDI
jgi:hypothetical protein